jgi:hypothetical protein
MTNSPAHGAAPCENFGDGREYFERRHRRFEDDAELLAAAQQSDAVALEALLVRPRPRSERLFTRFLKNTSEGVHGRGAGAPGRDFRPYIVLSARLTDPEALLSTGALESARNWQPSGATRATLPYGSRICDD